MRVAFLSKVFNFDFCDTTKVGYFLIELEVLEFPGSEVDLVIEFHGGVGDGGLLFILAEGDELVKVVVASLAGCKETTSFGDAEGDRHGDGVKVLQGNVMDFLVCEMKLHLEEITVLILNQVKEAVFLFMVSVGANHGTSIVGGAKAFGVRNAAFSSFIPSVDEKILTEDNDATWAIWRVRHIKQLMRGFWDDVAGLALDCVEPEVHLVDSEKLNALACDLAGIFILPIAVVDFDGGEERVIVPGV